MCATQTLHEQMYQCSGNFGDGIVVTNTLSINCKVIQKPNNLDNNFNSQLGMYLHSQTNENLKTPLVRFRFV